MLATASRTLAGLKASRIGAGVYGSVYSVDMRDNGGLESVARALMALRRRMAAGKALLVPREWKRVLKAASPVVAIKVVRASPFEFVSKFIESNLREASIQHYVNRSCAMLGNERVCGSDITPPIIMAGYLKNAKGSYFVTVMGFAHGSTLSEYGQSGRFTVADLESLERAMAVLWAIGVMHNDLHESNVIVSPRGNGRGLKVQIIDFGFASYVPHEFAYYDGQTPAAKTFLARNTIRKEVAAKGLRALYSLWSSLGIRAYADTVQRQRGQDRYNPNMWLLNRASRRVSRGVSLKTPATLRDEHVPVYRSLWKSSGGVRSPPRSLTPAPPRSRAPSATPTSPATVVRKRRRRRR